VGTTVVVGMVAVEVRTPAAAAGAGRPAPAGTKRAGGVGTDGPAGGAVPPPPLGPGAIGDGAHGEATPPNPGKAPGRE
jgi:hypothetical protein